MGSPSIDVTLTSSENHAINPGHEVEFTATVAPSDATGTVNFKLNGTTIFGCGTRPVSSGVATCETHSLVNPGDNAITAVFTGEGLFDGQTGTSSDLNQVVQGFSAVTLNVNPSPIVNGNSVTLTAAISPLSASGEVSFSVDNQAITGCEHAAVNVNTVPPTATCSVGVLPLGSYNFKADYHSNSALFVNSASSTITKVVKYASTVGVTPSLNPASVAKAVTLTAAVSTLASPAGGNVSFKIGGVAIVGCGSVAVSDGAAQCVVSLPIGNYNVTVEYTGDSTIYGSTSSTIPLVVNAAKYFMPRVGR